MLCANIFQRCNGYAQCIKMLRLNVLYTGRKQTSLDILRFYFFHLRLMYSWNSRYAGNVMVMSDG